MEQLSESPRSAAADHGKREKRVEWMRIWPFIGVHLMCLGVLVVGWSWAALWLAGAEMATTRPVVIVSLDVLNERLQSVTVCPLTTQLHPTWRTRVKVRVAKRHVEIAADQIRTISTTRLGKKLGALTPTDASALRRLITEMYCE